MGICSDDGMNNLITAIVEQAVFDYRQALAIDTHSFKAYKAKQDLAKAKSESCVIRKAFGDSSREYKDAMAKVGRCYNKAKKYEMAEWTIADCEKFFRGKWFAELVDIDPEWLITAIKSTYKIHLSVRR